MKLRWETAVHSNDRYLEDIDVLGDLEIDKRVKQK
jgi:hypothetical protein